MSMAVGSHKGPKADINITPYIDILLVMLIIFMVITPVHPLDLDVKVPQSEATDDTVKPTGDVIVVSVGESMQIRVNQDDTTIGDLGQKLLDIYSARPNKSMFVSASPKLPYGDVVKIIDIAKGAGVGDIGLLTEEIR